ncbi:MAG TPA: orotate phosphoribosyltransferase [Actinomycetota bacterium]|nr:orotate phosphoribosyltransferase [Actinomycetota bacterium]
MNPAEVVAVLERHGALLQGHFVLSSGRHSDVFVQKFRALEHPRLAQAFGDALARAFSGARFDVVASPAVGAIVLGFTTALAADARLVFAERVGGSLELRRGFRITPHERVLVVEDVVTTGGSARAVVNLVRAAGGVPVGVGALVDRMDPARPPSLGVPVRALARVEARSWEPSECPACRRGEALEDPGSSRLR